MKITIKLVQKYKLLHISVEISHLNHIFFSFKVNYLILTNKKVS